MMLVLTLGKRWLHQPAVVVVVNDVPDDVDPDDVFTAANRISDAADDVEALDLQWMKDLRNAIDTHNAPSMSVGDTFEKVSDDGQYLGGYAVMMSGWKLLTRSLL
jgi:hypothetical protein